MRRVKTSLDRQIHQAVELGENAVALKEPLSATAVLFSGMCGSAIGGDILANLFGRTSPVPFLVNRSSGIPHWVGPETLAVFSSYSGNTREVLEAFAAVTGRGARALVVTSGGRLAAAAKEQNVPVLLIPAGLMPRFAVGYLTVPLIPFFRKAGWLTAEDADCAEAAKVVRETPKAKALSLARTIKGRFIHLYGVSGISDAAALRWTTQLAENTKIRASHQVIPECFHNDIEAWPASGAGARKSAAIFLTDKEDPAWIQTKRKFAQSLMKKAGALVFEVPSRGRSLLARMFSLVSFGDHVSLELAR
ncbi:MAG: hypothetical protein L0Z48_08900, partial [candidate division Zixibacteria bacterium]|nr:hypothetical protein [candidate division Zixibacteria bacterium]